MSLAPSAMSDQPSPESIARLLPMDGSTPESAALHLAIANAERAVIGLPPQSPIRQSASVVPFPQTPAETHQRDVELLFCAPGAHARCIELQLAESQTAEKLADAIAQIAHGAEDANALTAKQRATVRFLATHAVRLTQDHWQQAAMTAAIQRCERWMREEGGRTFTDCSRQQLEHLSTSLAPWVVRAYLGISEGVTPLTPGHYLAIVNGGRR